MAGSSTIVVENLRKQFTDGSRPSVEDCSFEVEPGQLVVLLGPSGCGKTTLLKMINRLYEPTSGRIAIGGVDARQIPVTELRRRIGYVIQQTGLFPHMRVAANIGVVPRLLGWKPQRIAARVDELLALTGLPRHYRERYPRELSGGEQQRVGIARALAANPDILLMDEPFGALDAITRARLQDELLSLQRTLRKTILFVTHDVEEALRIADKIVVMRAGHIVQFDPPLHILTRPADPFVAELVGADDILRQLSLVTVGAALVAGAATLPKDVGPVLDGPMIEAGANMRAALALLLHSDVDAVRVVDGDGAVMGALSFIDVRIAVRELRRQHEIPAQQH